MPEPWIPTFNTARSMDTKTEATTDREIIITRLVRAPRALVWQACTEPEQIDQWWGPNGFTNRTIAFDLRVGGQWKYTMTAADGTVFPNLITWTEVSPIERLAYDHGDWQDPKLFQASLTLSVVDGGTLITLRNLFPSKQARDHVVKEFGAIEGGKQTLARLDGHLSALHASGSHAGPVSAHQLSFSALGALALRATRKFNAPIARVFAALTQAEQLKQWFGGPAGWTLDHCTYEPRTGGAYRYAWKHPHNGTMGVGGQILAFEPPFRVVATEHFDEAWYPGDAVSTIALTEEAGITTLTLTVEYASTEARDTALRSPMEQGMAAGYDALEQHLFAHA